MFCITIGLRKSGLSGAVFAHGLGVGDGGERGVTCSRAPNSSNTPSQHRLDRREDVFLGHEAHLDVELVELAGAAVGARVLVAKAGGDLEIAVEAGDHGELLELLGRLRQR